MHYLLLFLLTISYSFNSFALTVHKEVSSMAEVISDIAKVSHNPRSTLIVFDIDNTLLAMNRFLGSDQWFNWKGSLIKSKNPKLFKDLLEWQGILFAHGGMRLTEQQVPRYVKMLQSKKYPVIALTSRSPSYREATERELHRNGISFSKSRIGRNLPGKKILPGKKREVSYTSGIFMTSGMHKGEMLMYLIKKSFGGRIPFTQIVFVDDHIKNTKRVFDSFNSIGIEVAAYRYSHEDTLVKKFHSSNQLKGATTKELKLLRGTLLRVFKQSPQMI